MEARLKAASGGVKAKFFKTGGLSKVYRVKKRGRFRAYVIKLRVWSESLPRDVAHFALHRELVIEKLLEQLAGHAFFRGKRFIRMAKNLATRAEQLSGTLKMEFVTGPSAAELAEAVALLRKGPNWKAEELLKKAGLTLEEADKMLRSLEEFYGRTHYDVLNFIERKLGYRALQNESNAQRGHYLPVGIDYNHGVNVIWNAKERMFVIVDW